MRERAERKSGGLLRFVVVSAAVLFVMLGVAYGVFYALNATRHPDYQGRADIKIPKNAPFR